LIQSRSVYVRYTKIVYRNMQRYKNIFLSFLLFFAPFFVSANATLTLDDDNVTISQQIGINVDCSLAQDVTHRIYMFSPDGITLADINCNAGVPYYFDNYTITGQTSWTTYPDKLGTYTFWYIPSPDEYPLCITYDGDTDDLTACQTEFPTMYQVASLVASETGENGGGGGGYLPVGSTMTFGNTQNTVLNSLLDWGLAVLAIIGFVIGIGVAYLIFRFGWKKIQNSLN